MVVTDTRRAMQMPARKTSRVIEEFWGIRKERVYSEWEGRRLTEENFTQLVAFSLSTAGMSAGYLRLMPHSLILLSSVL